ncbi:hypothetical protein CEXT_650991 [Caerostris extrusa]|uniref:Uncharacterized protein n=1 Tax=Caerostris extrusa TaxID=172846 RepID=A0AAV4XZQ9_CAEEX|nr:hypothetical protein CEXT_650991 [Caerostris extrusa]
MVTSLSKGMAQPSVSTYHRTKVSCRILGGAILRTLESSDDLHRKSTKELINKPEEDDYISELNRLRAIIQIWVGTALKWMEFQTECDHLQLLIVKQIRSCKEISQDRETTDFNRYL